MKQHRTKTVLVVEDEELVRQFVTVCLRHHGYRVVEAEDGQTGLAHFQKHHDEIDLILTDVRMPKMDGPQMVRAIQKLDPAITIIFMSGTAGLSELPKHAGKDFRLLHKPFTAERLVQCIQQCLVRLDER